MTVVSSCTIATVLSLQTLCTCIIFTLGQYIYIFYLQSYPFSSHLIQNLTNHTLPSFLYKINKTSPQKCSSNNNSFDGPAQVWAQQKSADLFFWTNVWSCIPIIIMTYILGVHTPKLGRRFVLLLPILGTAVQISIWLSIIYYHLPEYWWYIAAFIVGLSGADNVRNFVLNLFITENTIESERSSRFVLFGGISTVVSAIGTFAIGYYIAWQGFNDLYWTALILQIVSIFIVRFYFKSDYDQYKTLSNSDSHIPDIQISRNSCNNSHFNICTIFSFKNRSKKKFLSLTLTLIAYASYSFICTAFIVLLLYLLNTPFCWTSKQIGNYMATVLISFGILSVFGMKILTKFGACDIVICIISHVFFCIASFWVAFAQSNWQMYAGLVLSSFGGYQNLLTLSMISKWLEPYERTNAFTLVTEINTIMKVLGYCFFNWVYARTVIYHKNFTFLLAATLSMIPLIMNICLWFVSRWMSDEVIDQLEEVDMESKTPLVAADWASQIADRNSLLIPQPGPNLSRSSSISSVDFEKIDLHENNIDEV